MLCVLLSARNRLNPSTAGEIAAHSQRCAHRGHDLIEVRGFLSSVACPLIGHRYLAVDSLVRRLCQSITRS
jgi:nitrite reductase/ring-hydroxylating ferredoxin subunit